MVVEPGRVRWKHLRLEHDLAPGRIVPHSQQRMTRAGLPASGRFNPVTAPLERIVWRRDPTPGFPNEQSVEGNRQARLVCLRDRVHSKFRKRLDAASEGHRLPGVTPPIGRVQRPARLQHPARYVAHHRHGRRRWTGSNISHRRLQAIQDRLHHAAVVSRTGAQSPHPYLLRLQLFQHRLDVIRRSADHLERPVVHGNAQPNPIRGNVMLDPA